jgi:hypothetical protein
MNQFPNQPCDHELLSVGGGLLEDFIAGEAAFGAGEHLCLLAAARATRTAAPLFSFSPSALQAPGPGRRVPSYFRASPCHGSFHDFSGRRKPHMILLQHFHPQLQPDDLYATCSFARSISAPKTRLQSSLTTTSRWAPDHQTALRTHTMACTSHSCDCCRPSFACRRLLTKSSFNFDPRAITSSKFPTSLSSAISRARGQ